MPNINKILRAAETMGDFSSFKTGKIPQRARNKLVGGTAGKAQANMGITGLIFWAQFLNFLYKAVRAAAAEEMYVGTVVNYAAGYEFGFANPSGMRRQRKYFRPGVRKALSERKSSSLSPIPNKPDLRSGIYEGSQFLADVRALSKGDPVGRTARRAAGAATTRFFWGALTNPDVNVLESVAKNIRRFVRKAIRKQDLIETGCLLMSIQIGESPKEVRRKSVQACANALGNPHIGEISGDIGSLETRVG